eukprot:Skav229576  [mRNA]  locus=scaffold568:769569:775299:+ [translate_table: standard]
MAPPCQLWRARKGRWSEVAPPSQEEDLSFRCEALRVQLDSFATATEAIGAVARGKEWSAWGWVVGWETPASLAEQLAQELRGHVKEAASSPHANYVLQKAPGRAGGAGGGAGHVITQLRPHASTFIAEELLDSGARFARHRFGCRILCRLLEHCTTESSTQRLISRILEDPSEALELCRHNFGHHVVQLVLERGHPTRRGSCRGGVVLGRLAGAERIAVDAGISGAHHAQPRHKELVLQVLYKDLATNAAHRRASYVVEAALNNCSPQEMEPGKG